MAFFFYLNLSFTICGMDLRTSIDQPLESNELSTVSHGYISLKSQPCRLWSSLPPSCAQAVQELTLYTPGRGFTAGTHSSFRSGDRELQGR